MRTLGSRGATVLYASIIVSLLAGSSAPTPLYATYQQLWGFGPVAVTVIFGIYGVSVLAGLLVLGRLSDHVGRRPVVAAALGVQAVALVLFVVADGLGSLLVARVVQGLSAGAAMSALGAALLDIDEHDGPTTNAVAPGVGTATGALLAGVVVQFLPAPTQLVYLVLLAVVLAQAAALGLVAETVTRTPGARRALRPELRAPAAVRPAMAIAAPVLFATWALPSFYGSLGPAVLRELTGSPSPLWGAVGIGVLTASAATGTLVTRSLAPQRALLTGVAAMIGGLVVLIVGLGVGVPAVFLAATVVTGLGFGCAFQGGIRLVVADTGPDERAGTMATLYVVAYSGLALPGVLAGTALVALDGVADVTTVAQGHAAVVMTLAALAAVLLVRHRRSRRRHLACTQRR